MTTTPLDTPAGRIHYADAIKAEHWGIYESKEALMLGIIADPWYFGTGVTIIRFTKTEDGDLYAVYTKCKAGDNYCTLDRICKAEVTRALKVREIEFELWDENFTELYNEAFDQIAEKDIEPVLADCEQVERIDYELIEIGVIVK